MKNKVLRKIIDVIMPSLIAAALTVSALFCFTNTLKISVDSYFVAIAVACALLGAVPALFPKHRKIIVAVMLGVFALAVCWKLSGIVDGFERILYFLTTKLNRFFGFKITGIAFGNSHYIFLAFSVGLTAWLASLMQGFRKGFYVIAALCVPSVLFSLMFVNAAPVPWITVFTLFFLILLITDRVRRFDTSKANENALVLITPCAVLVTALLVYYNPISYSRPAWIDDIRIKLEDILDKDDNPGTEGGAQSPQLWEGIEEVRLNQLFENTTGKEELKFRSSTKINYLRGVTYARYDGMWRKDYYIAPDGDFSWKNAMYCGFEPKYTLEIKTAGIRTQIFTALNPHSTSCDSYNSFDRYIHNERGASEYTVYFCDKINEYEGYVKYLSKAYLNVEDGTVSLLKKYGLEGASPEEIASFVRNSAVYDKDPPDLTKEYREENNISEYRNINYTQYFLEKSKRGYCTHFATATAMLLRANGIPARFVTGYYVAESEPNEWYSVKDTDRHAWVEYYVEGEGWKIIESTPGFEIFESAPPENEQNSSHVIPDDSSEPSQENSSQQPSQENSSHQSSDTSDSSQSTGSSEDGGEKNGKLPIAHLIAPAAAVLTVVLGFAAYRKAFFALSKRKMMKKDKNKRLLYCWRKLCTVCKETGKAPSAESLFVARKARFSNHTVTDDEFKLVTDELQNETRELKAKEKYSPKRFYHKYIRILY
ncbi:MAG: transglutaminase domain-containing protein [Clostridia bacterium]|nr:transglutaminase domain-containing protein [Clostridia bacterium]